jgi:hypothetical protein
MPWIGVNLGRDLESLHRSSVGFPQMVALCIACTCDYMEWVNDGLGVKKKSTKCNPTSEACLPCAFCGQFTWCGTGRAGFCQGTSIRFDEEAEIEENIKCLHVSTAKSVARTLYAFFTEKPNACVAFC